MSPSPCVYFPYTKNLLDHLEEKTPLEDEVLAPQALSEQNDEAGTALSSLPEVPPWTGEVNPPQRDGSVLGRGPWDPSDRSAFLKSKLRALLTAPRSLRRSSCFGGRIDRIGAQSGLGCNSFRVRGTVDGNGMGVGSGEQTMVFLRLGPCHGASLVVERAVHMSISSESSACHDACSGSFRTRPTAAPASEPPAWGNWNTGPCHLCLADRQPVVSTVVRVGQI